MNELSCSWQMQEGSSVRAQQGGGPSPWQSRFQAEGEVCEGFLTGRFFSAFLHHLRAPSAHFSVTPACRGAAGQHLDFLERPRGTGPRFQETPSVGHSFFYFSQLC